MFCSDEQNNCPLNKMAATFQMSDVVINARGSKTSRLRTNGGADVVYSTANNNGLCAPFGPCNFDRAAQATRMNLAVRLDDEADLAFFAGLDEWGVRYISETPSDYLSAR